MFRAKPPVSERGVFQKNPQSPAYWLVLKVGRNGLWGFRPGRQGPRHRKSVIGPRRRASPGHTAVRRRTPSSHQQLLFKPHGGTRHSPALNAPCARIIPAIWRMSAELHVLRTASLLYSGNPPFLKRTIFWKISYGIPWDSDLSFS